MDHASTVNNTYYISFYIKFLKTANDTKAHNENENENENRDSTTNMNVKFKLQTKKDNLMFFSLQSLRSQVFMLINFTVIKNSLSW